MKTEMDSTDMALIRKNNLEKVVVKFNDYGSDGILCKIGYYPLYVSGSDSYFIKENMTTRISYSSYSIKKLGHKNEFASDFIEEYQKNCTDDCLMNRLNQTFGCIPAQVYHLSVNLEKYILNLKYRFCEFNVTPDKSEEIISRCSKVCLFNEVKIFETSTQTIKSATNETALELIQKKLPHIEYIEALKMNFDQLIYDCGGILGLWFGLSPKNLQFFKDNLPLIKPCLKLIATNLILFFMNIIIFWKWVLESISRKFILFFRNRERDLIVFWKWALNKD
jgi:hypothetical protein